MEQSPTNLRNLIKLRRLQDILEFLLALLLKTSIFWLLVSRTSPKRLPLQLRASMTAWPFKLQMLVFLLEQDALQLKSPLISFLRITTLEPVFTLLCGVEIFTSTLVVSCNAKLLSIFLASLPLLLARSSLDSPHLHQSSSFGST